MGPTACQNRETVRDPSHAAGPRPPRTRRRSISDTLSGRTSGTSMLAPPKPDAITLDVVFHSERAAVDRPDEPTTHFGVSDDERASTPSCCCVSSASAPVDASERAVDDGATTTDRRDPARELPPDPSSLVVVPAVVASGAAVAPCPRASPPAPSVAVTFLNAGWSGQLTVAPRFRLAVRKPASLVDDDVDGPPAVELVQRSRTDPGSIAHAPDLVKGTLRASEAATAAPMSEAAAAAGPAAGESASAGGSGDASDVSSGAAAGAASGLPPARSPLSDSVSSSPTGARGKASSDNALSGADSNVGNTCTFESPLPSTVAGSFHPFNTRLARCSTSRNRSAATLDIIALKAALASESPEPSWLPFTLEVKTRPGSWAVQGRETAWRPSVL
mmetsp:Transcript_16232/g.50826  ORF Transcript_16232/g.50826 Transcript_16232/m.50826 type:complete len:389 (-) Transcript_16232:1546-2712(-)